MYIYFANSVDQPPWTNSFNSVDHEALWRWLQEINVPDVDFLRDHAHYTADLAYGKTASISLTKQGDQLSPQHFDLVFNCLLLALRATGIASRFMTGLRSPARGFADDLVLCTESAADMNREYNRNFQWKRHFFPAKNTPPVRRPKMS